MGKNMKSNSLISTIVLPLAIFSAAVAGDRTDIRAVGMGRTMNASSRGVDALGINPANIALPDGGRFTLNLVPVGVRISTDILNYGLYQDYFTGVPDSTGNRVKRFLTDADKQNILSQMPDFPENRVEAEMMWLGFTFQNPIFGGIGFSMTEHIGMTSTLSKDFFRRAFFGLDENGDAFNFDGTQISAWWYRSYNISYARRLPVKIKFLKDLYAGIGIKFVQGFGIFQVLRQKSSFSIYPDSTGTQYNLNGNIDYLATRAGIDLFNNNNDSTNSSFSPFPQPVGTGTGFDIGFSGELFNGIRLAMSVTDIGKITWDKNVLENVGMGEFSFQNDFSALGDTIKNLTRGEPRPGPAFTTSLPTALRLGASMELHQLPFVRKTFASPSLVAIDYTQGLNESLGNTTNPRFSLGMEYRPVSVLPLRTGWVFGGGDKVRWAAGFGIDLYNFSMDFATDSFTTLLTPRSFQMASFSFGMKVRV
jgi:hypothetical protein